MDKIKGLIGISKKAGKLVQGQDQVIKLIKLNKLSLVIMAENSGKNTEKKIEDKTNYYNIDLIKIFSKEELGQILGREIQGVIGIKDKGIGKKIVDIYNKQND